MVHHDGVGVGEMLACCRVKLIEFALIREAHLQDLFSQAADQVRSDRPARVTDGIHRYAGVHRDVLQPCLAIELGHPAPDVRIGAVPRKAVVKSSDSRSNAG